jgi:hypothetical protein
MPKGIGYIIAVIGIILFVLMLLISGKKRPNQNH